jgi:hypothetical protein
MGGFALCVTWEWLIQLPTKKLLGLAGPLLILQVVKLLLNKLLRVMKMVVEPAFLIGIIDVA